MTIHSFVCSLHMIYEILTKYDANKHVVNVIQRSSLSWFIVQLEFQVVLQVTNNLMGIKLEEMVHIPAVIKNVLRRPDKVIVYL